MLNNYRLGDHAYNKFDDKIFKTKEAIDKNRNI